MPKFEEKTIATQKIFQGHIINVQVDDVVLPNGKVGKRELVKHPGAVAIIAITPDEKIVLVEQFRKPLERTIIEIPAGKMEAGELPLHTAKRELEEETGYGAENWEHVQTFSTSPGFADEIIHIYVAQNLYEVSNRAAMDEDEFVELIEVSVIEAQQLIKNEQIYDAKTVFAIQWCLLNKLTKK